NPNIPSSDADCALLKREEGLSCPSVYRRRGDMASRGSYELAPMDGSEEEDRPFLYEKRSRRSSSPVEIFNKIMAFVNVILALALASSLALVTYLWNSRTANCKDTVNTLEPYSPALEAVHPVIKKFKPNLIFQSESSDAVEAAWKSILGEDGGSFVALSSEVSAKLDHESVESLWEPGKHVYGMSMWNKNYTVSDEDGREQHSDWFESLNPDERATNSSVFWNIEHSCRMFEAIDEWGKRHSALPKGVSFDTGDECVTPLCKGELHDKAPESSVGGHEPE
ncbi:MAG: hypothetical protein Q9214_005797, partial [Letrouitia sp. 1 TL-2023]